VWTYLDDSQIDVDMDEFADLFAAAEVKPRLDKSVVEKNVEVIDSNKSKAIVILLSGLKMSAEDIITRRKSLDGSAFTELQLASLRAQAPTQDDYKAIDGWSGSPARLGRAEQFYIGIRPMKLFVPHIEFLMLAGSDQAIGEVKESYDRLRDSLNAIANSRTFLDVLTFVLKLGNIMNGGTPRGGAYGFFLQFLPKIVDVRSRVPGITLLHYIAKKKLPDVDRLAAELAPLTASETIELEPIKGKLAEVVGNVKKLETVMREAESLIPEGYQLFPKYTAFRAQ
jgi:hypothetical protein